VPIGGLLNLVRLATPVALWLILGIGLVLFVLHAKSLRMRWPREDSAQVEVLVTVGLITLVVGVAIFTQLPPSALNYHDDFQKYLAHPVRMLATGTLFGSPLSAIGSESLGGLAFLQAFPLLVAPVEYINGVDAILAFLLLMMLGASAGWGRLVPLPCAALAPLLIAFINPQYVNVSSLFTGAALMATAVMLVADDRENSPPSQIMLGLIYGGLVALKPVFVLFPLVHLPLTALSIAYAGKSWRAGLVWGFQTGLCSAAALLPWLMLHAPHYLSMQALPNDPIPPAATPDRLHIFSINTLAYGTTHAHYSMLLVLTLVVAGMSIGRLAATGVAGARPNGTRDCGCGHHAGFVLRCAAGGRTIARRLRHQPAIRRAVLSRHRSLRRGAGRVDCRSSPPWHGHSNPRRLVLRGDLHAFICRSIPAGGADRFNSGVLEVRATTRLSRLQPRGAVQHLG
jgi:hypothetical protein